MARIGIKNVLIDWLETSKTYHGPINLRFTWPIELTKTYHLIGWNYSTRLLYLLGNTEHGLTYRIEEAWDSDPDSCSIKAEKFHQGRRIYRFRRKYDEIGLIDKTEILDVTVSAPQLLHVRKFLAKGYGAPVEVVLVRNRRAVANIADNRIRVYRHGLYQMGIPVGPSYSGMLQKLIELTE